MADRILNQLIQLDIINGEEEEIYRFGLEALLLKSLHYLSYLSIAVLAGQSAAFLLFFISFLLLRRNAGGYHAKTKLRCYVGSCLTVAGAVMCMRYAPLHQEMCFWKICAVLLFISNILIWLLAPSGNRNRTLDEEEKKYFKRKTKKFLIGENVLLFLLIPAGEGKYAISIELAIICQAILLLLEKARKDNMEIGTGQKINY